MTSTRPLSSHKNNPSTVSVEGVTLSKDPWFAANLSMFFPGIGQFYAEKFFKGILFFIGQITLLITGIWSLFAPDGQTLSGLLIIVISVIFYLFNILDAHLSVYYDRRYEIQEKIPRKHKNPWFAVFVSRVLPGLGHLYLKRPLVGLILLTISLIFLQLNNFYQALLFVVPLITAIAAYDSYHTFHKSPDHNKRALVAIMVGIIFFTGLIGTYLPSFIDQQLEQFLIPSPSMYPTLHIGDRIFVTQSDHYQPKRGDVIVFHPPEALIAMDGNESDFFIKRVIGRPYDTLKIEQGVVYVNGTALREPYIAEPPDYELKQIEVPENAYFVLGDNRNDSVDSHYWGFLPKELIFGRAYKIYWPFNRVQSLILRGN